MTDSSRALFAGVSAVVRAPLLLLLVLFATMMSALPFAILVAGRIQSALAHQPPIDLGAEEIDAEWWMEYRKQARGLEATFTPAIIGFAAPLDNLSALLDASSRPIQLALPVALSLVVWAFLWGGVLDRFQRQSGHAKTFIAASARHFPRMLGVSAIVAAIVMSLYGSVHRVLFGPIFASIASAAPGEREAFAARVGLYALFGALLAAVSLAADYTRIDMVRFDGSSLRASWWRALSFMRDRWRSVLPLYLCTAGLFVAMFVAYGVADQRFGGWRSVIAGQIYIVARLAVRLIAAASEVQLYDMSRVSANPGPPAAT